ncbi:hypothetical protein [Brachybacterium muris]|uniref:Uncharacterized protein n=1 Tax=Brachybacterium muris UCD-AY4 TaxID=1249481 RepID=A0A022KYI6_9MICO|nr:hypothetical protein [Brachybacterium muris]EYT49542.1 hypothetical protein D641_0108630 [Brachybacterium muris UCD-AY4]MCT1655004.1 hypothetical protein [Brachybacterium muris]
MTPSGSAPDRAPGAPPADPGSPTPSPPPHSPVFGNRRALLRGIGWATPTAVVSTVVPAYAMSQHDVRFDVNFDGGSGANGFYNTTYLNLGIAPGGTAPFVLTQDLVISVEVVGLNPDSSRERSFSAGSSDGTIVRGTYNPATRTIPLTWTIRAGRSIPRAGIATSNPDIYFIFNDGGLSNRITNKIVITSITGGSTSRALPIDSSVIKDYRSGNVSPDGIY